MWERVIEFTCRFVVDLIRGVYPLETIIHLIILGLAASVLEITVCHIQGISQRNYGWIKNGLLSFGAAFVLVGFNVFLFSCLQRAFPNVGYPLPDHGAAAAEISMLTTWAVLISCVVIRLIQGKQIKVTFNLFWLVLSAGCVAATAYAIRWMLSFSMVSDWGYISAGIIAALLTLILSALQEAMDKRESGTESPTI